MSKYSTVRVGLEKPPIGDKTIFYASLDGTIQPEVGELPTWIHDSGISFKAGAYGLQAIGAMVYPIKGLSLEKPFTFAYTYNVFDDSYVSSWTGILILSLKDKDSSNDNKIFTALTTDALDKNSQVQGVVVSYLEDSPYIGGDRQYWSEQNKYNRVTITSDGKFLECYLNGFLLKKLDLTKYKIQDDYKGTPEMQLDLNWGHNKTGAQKFGLSEILITQEYLPPVGLSELPLGQDNTIIMPRPCYLGVSSLREVEQNLSVTLPASWNSNNNLINNYVCSSDKQSLCQKGFPNVKIKGRLDGLKWSNGDKIIIDGIFGELIVSSPTVIVEGTNTPITGSWSGIGTNSATFTISNILEELRSKSLTVSYSVRKAKLNKPLLDIAVNSILGINFNNRLILPNPNSDELCYKFNIKNMEESDLVFYPSTFTLECKYNEPYELLVVLNTTTPKSLDSSTIEYLAEENYFITTSALNQKLDSYPKFLKYLVSSDSIPKNIKSNICFGGCGVPMNIKGLSNVFSTQSVNSITLHKTSNGIAIREPNFGDISLNNIIPVFLKPALAKVLSTGELILVVDMSLANSSSTAFNSSNINSNGLCYIPTGVFIK